MKKFGVCGLAVVLFLCGCSSNEEKKEEVIVPQTEVTMNDNAVESLATKPWQELDIYTEREVSIQNSNLLNRGYLANGEDGQIFFVDFQEEAIYSCGYNGEDKSRLADMIGYNLQYENGMLYLQNENSAIIRIDVANGEAETIWNEPCGEFRIQGNTLFINTPEGFLTYNLEDEKQEIVFAGQIEKTSITGNGKGFWLSNAINGTDVSFFMKGYIVGSDQNVQDEHLIKERALYPLLAGDYLSYFDTLTSSLHVLSFKSDEDIDLKIYHQRPVSDGEHFYFVDASDIDLHFQRWNGTKEEILITENNNNTVYLFLSSECLYWMIESWQEQIHTSEWFYYNLQTTEMGSLQ